MGEKNETLWLSVARSATRRFNLAWFLEKLSLPLVIVGIVGAALILLLRRESDFFPWQQFSILTTGALFVIIFIAWLIAKKQFTTKERSLVRIEDSMALNNSLTAAHQGIAPWPELQEETSDGTSWNWPRLLITPIATLLLLSIAFLLPISALTTPEDSEVEEPANREALQASLEELRENETLNEEYLDEIQDKVNELSEQPKDEWFDHSSLEAVDSLKTSHEQQLRELERNMKKAERSLNALQNHGENMTPGTRERLLDQFDQSLQQMNQGAMKPNQALMDQLGQLDPSQLGSLTQEQLDQLRANMRKQAQNMQNAGEQQGQGNQSEDWLDELMQEGGPG